MNKRTFSELPADYQTGCNSIEKQCSELLMASQIKFGAIYWDNLDLVFCYLYVQVANKTYHAKFGKRALTHFHDVGMMPSILISLKRIDKRN